MKTFHIIVSKNKNKNYSSPDNIIKYLYEFSDMVVIFLAKSQQNVTWSHMTELEKKSEDQRNNRYKPTESEKADPQESIMSLMRNM